MVHYLLNAVAVDAAGAPAVRELASRCLAVGMWGVAPDERHCDALAPGDLALVYLGAPERAFIGRAALASAVHDWTPSEAERYPGEDKRGVLLSHVEVWVPPVPMAGVLAQIGPSDTAKADFEAGVVRIVESEYDAALATAADRSRTSRAIARHHWHC